MYYVSRTILIHAKVKVIQLVVEWCNRLFVDVNDRKRVEKFSGTDDEIDPTYFIHGVVRYIS